MANNYYKKGRKIYNLEETETKNVVSSKGGARAKTKNEMDLGSGMLEDIVNGSMKNANNKIPDIKSIEKDVLTKTNEEVEISIDTNLDEFAKTVKEKIINTNSSAYSTLKIYTLKKEILTKKFSSKEITESILSFTSLLKKNNITPKAYSFTIINEDDLTKTISLDNLTEDNLEYNYLSSLIQTKLN